MISLPQIAPPPQNRFNRDARSRHEADLKAFEAVREAVASSLQRAQWQVDRQGTDIWGALRKAQDLQATHVVLITDLEDNRNRRVPVDLANAKVYVVYLHRIDVKASTRRRQHWLNELKQARAGEVVFLDLQQNAPQF